MPQLGDVVDLMAAWFDPAWAEQWDAVGLVCGDRAEPADTIVLAVDPVPATVEEALAGRAGLLITHHPLLLTPVHSVPADDPKGALVHRLVRGRCGLLVAHTNADVARPGVSDALAERIGLVDLAPLAPVVDAGLRKLVVFVPVTDTDPLVDALAAAGAGAIGDYDRCAWTTEGTGTFRPLAGARPTLGRIGAVETVPEARVEMVVPARRQAAVLAALRSAHPYEEPAFDLLVQAPMPSRRGTGRVGLLEQPMTLREFVAHVARVLPATRWGVRAAGDPQRTVRTVAVCGGSGGSLIGTARAAGADVLVTADLKHHPALEEVGERGDDGICLVDAAHWATEAPWLDAVAARLVAHLGDSVEVRVSRRVTDPWTLHLPSTAATSTEGHQ